MELGSDKAIKQGISGGQGISVLSQHNTTRGCLNDLAILDIEGFAVSWQWYVGHPRRKRLSIVTKTFIDFMYQHVPSLLPYNIATQVMV